MNDQYGTSTASWIYGCICWTVSRGDIDTMSLLVNCRIRHQSLAIDRNYQQGISSWKMSAAAMLVSCIIMTQCCYTYLVMLLCLYNAVFDLFSEQSTIWIKFHTIQLLDLCAALWNWVFTSERYFLSVQSTV